MGLVAMTPTCLPCRPVLASRGMDFFYAATARNLNTPEIIASGDGFPRFRPRLGSWMENYLRNRGGDLEKGSKKCYIWEDNLRLR